MLQLTFDAQKNVSIDLHSKSEKRHRDKGEYPLKRLVSYLSRYRAMVGITLFALIIAAGATLVLPFAIRMVIDNGFKAENQAVIDQYFVYLLITALVLALASALRFYCVYWLGERLVADLKQDVFGKLISMSAAFFDVNHSGELMSRLAADTTLISAAIRASVSQALRNIVVMVGGIVMMIVSSSQLSLMVIIAIPLIVLPLVFYGRIVRRLSSDAQTAQADLNKFGAEVFANMRVVQAFNSSKLVTKRFQDANERSVDKALSRTLARATLTAVAIFLVMASIIAILWYGASAVISGEITAGSLVQFMLYAVFAGGAMGSLTEVWGEVAQAAGAADRLADFLDLEDQVKEPQNPVQLSLPVAGQIEFKNVTFSYPSRAGETAINKLSLEIPAKSRIAIVGPSGAGKTTIFQLLLRFYDPTHGLIYLDGVPINTLSLDALRSQFSYVSQDASLFDMSILDNIRFAKPEASRDEVINAAKLAEAHEFIEGFGRDYDELVGEGGNSLSGGQRQRIALARAILRDAPILLLDEATSSLDTLVEKKVHAALDGYAEPRTSIIIAHRLSTVQNADHILVLKEGRLVESGTHSELLEKGLLYADLVKTQLKSE